MEGRRTPNGCLPVMGLQVKQGETITVSVQGGDEQKIADQIRGIFEAEQL